MKLIKSLIDNYVGLFLIKRIRLGGVGMPDLDSSPPKQLNREQPNEIRESKNND
jgi:hypothetical protein